MACSTPGRSVPHLLLSLPKLMCIESGMPSDHLILCHPLLHPYLLVIFFHDALIFNLFSV